MLGNKYIGLPIRCFTTPSQPTSGGKRVTTKTLCDITGTRYYEHNEEINLLADKVVRVYDENEQIIGDMKFGEAYS